MSAREVLRGQALRKSVSIFGWLHSRIYGYQGLGPIYYPWENDALMSQTHIFPRDIAERVRNSYGYLTMNDAGAGYQAVQENVDVSLVISKPIETRNQRLPAISSERRSRSMDEKAFDPESFLDDIANQTEEQDTVLYLAYGSNLSEATFKGVRGIKPLAQLNVLVPELALAFDLPGIPYSEPCFANVRHRNKPQTRRSNILSNSEKPPKYHKDRWKKGLVGVVYEVSKKDFATIIATEGGTMAYKDVVVTCYPLPENVSIVPENPRTSPFQAHTLFAPGVSEPPPGNITPNRTGRLHRPDPSYAQPSPRYLRLITEGADEHDLPEEYKLYLHGIRTYTVTTSRQLFGQFLFVSVWMPVIFILVLLQRILKDERGRSPKWLVEVSAAIFKMMWASYDRFFKNLFGDGERTVGLDEQWGYHGENLA